MEDHPGKATVLLVEDDDRLASMVSEYLQRYEFSVSVVRRGDEAVERVRQQAPDLIILDLMLPFLDGMEVCRQVRAFAATPILMLTARHDAFDQVAGLEAGADDYVIKPVEPRVLVARARALLRRLPASRTSSNADQLEFGLLSISPANRTVTYRGQNVELKTVEYDLLLILASEAGKVLSRDDILQRMRGIAFDGFDRTVDAGISRLRRRFEDNADEPQKIKTIWGRGYLFSPMAWAD